MRPLRLDEKGMTRPLRILHVLEKYVHIVEALDEYQRLRDRRLAFPLPVFARNTLDLLRRATKGYEVSTHSLILLGRRHEESVGAASREKFEHCRLPDARDSGSRLKSRHNIIDMI